MSNPWLKFFPSDWRADPSLRMCSVAARGLWMEMLCVMHEADPRGSLFVNGRPITERQLAGLAGITVDEISSLLQELEDAGVFSRDGDVIFSRRMRREDEKAARDKANGSKGGNPKLASDNPPLNPRLNPGVNPQDNVKDKGQDKAQKLEAISYKLEEEDKNNGSNEPSCLVASPKRVRNAYPEDFDQFWSGYPKTPTMSKKETFDAWKRVSVEEREKAVAALPAFRAYCAAKPDYPVVHACRFLSKQRADGFLNQPTILPFAQPTARNHGASNAALQHIINRSAAREAAGGIEIIPPARGGY